MAKVRITHPDTGVVYVVDVNNLTEEDLRRLERLNIAEEVEEKPLAEKMAEKLMEEKPKRKRKKMSDKHRTTEYYKNVDNTKENGEA